MWSRGAAVMTMTAMMMVTAMWLRASQATEFWIWEATPRAAVPVVIPRRQLGVKRKRKGGKHRSIKKRDTKRKQEDDKKGFEHS
jgi:hypothetical protein